MKIERIMDENDDDEDEPEIECVIMQNAQQTVTEQWLLLEVRSG